MSIRTRSGLQVEEATDYRQIVLHPMMNFAQKSFFSFRAGAELGGNLFGYSRLSHPVECVWNSKGKHGRRGE